MYAYAELVARPKGKNADVFKNRVLRSKHICTYETEYGGKYITINP
jgi:hypothetical protein